MAFCPHIGVTALAGGSVLRHFAHTLGSQRWRVALSYGILPTHWGHSIGGWLCLMTFSSHTEVTTFVGGSDGILLTH